MQGSLSTLSNIYVGAFIYAKILNSFLLPNLSVPEKLENSIFEIPIIPQILHIKNYKTTSVKSMNLDIIRQLKEYPLKTVLVKAMFTLTIFNIILFEGRSILWPAQRVTGNERVNYFLKKKDRYKYCIFDRVLNRPLQGPCTKTMVFDHEYGYIILRLNIYSVRVASPSAIAITVRFPIQSLLI